MYHLQLFGELQLTGVQGPVLGNSRPLQILVLACLSRRPKSTSDVLQTLWPNVEKKRRQQSLRQAMYKLNKAAPGLVTIANQRFEVCRELVTTDLDLVSTSLDHGDIAGLSQVIRGSFLPDLANAGIELEQWVDVQFAEHWEPLLQRVRKHFRSHADKAEWQTVILDYQQLAPPLADDPAILFIAARSFIYCSESTTARREISEMIRRLRSRSRKQAERLEVMLKRRLRWDKAAKLHIGPFVGRTSELRVFDEVYKNIAGGGGFVCCLTGPIGIGKTRTARQFARVAAVRGSRVRTVHLALDQHNANYAKVARALQQLGPTRSPPASSVGTSTLRSYPAASSSVLLVVDDLDWAGPACTNLLLELVATLGESSLIGIVVTAKEPAAAQRLLAVAPHGIRAVHLRLQRLNGADRQALISWLRDRYGLTDEEATEVDTYSGGVPAYAHRFARRSQHPSSRHKLPAESLEELRRLVPGALRLFALISFCGGKVSSTALSAALEIRIEDVHRLATQLIELGLIELKEDHHLETVDQCAADTIQREFELTELRQLGARVALETAATSRLDAARIANRIGNTELESRCYFESAREAIGFGAYSDAEVFLSKCSSTTANRRLSARADYWQAEIHLKLRRYEEALAAYSSLLTTDHLLSARMLAVAKARHAQVLTMKDPELASAAFDVASRIRLRDLRRKAPRAVADILLATASIAIVSGDHALLRRTADRLERELSRSTSNPHWLELAATLCKIRLQIDGFSCVLDVSDRYVRRARLSAEPTELASTLLTAAIVRTAAGQLSAADAFYTEAAEIVRTNRLLGFTHILSSNHAVTLLEMGSIDEALVRLHALREKDTNIGVGYYLAFDHLNLSTAYLERGDLENAKRHADEALAHKGFFPNREHATALAIRGITILHAGDILAAQALVREVDAIGQKWGDLSYSAILKALVLKAQGHSSMAVRHLLSTAEQCDANYRPAALRLRVLAAEIEAERNTPSALVLAQQCVQDAAAFRMQSVEARAARIIQHRR